MARFFANRAAWTAGNHQVLPMPFQPDMGDGKVLARAPEAVQQAQFETAFADARSRADVIVIDTPGGDTPLSRLAHGLADQIVTPMNDSFVDFDLLGEVDPVTLELLKPSIYSESVWEARKHRAITEGRAASIDWIVVTNRLAVAAARNRQRLEERMEKLARRVGFRIGPGLRDRVIYRELFPFGLTVADLSNEIRPVAVSLAHVAARQELRSLMKALGLDDGVQVAPLDAAA
jgi:chromosome partitioning protein